jgi:hypothetical protein
MLPPGLELGTHHEAESWHPPIYPARSLRHRPLPDDAGSTSLGEADRTSGQARPRPGRIKSVFVAEADRTV